MLEGAHPHLLINHFPIVGSVISVLIFAAGFLLKNEIVKKTALALIVFSALMTIPAYLTGHEAAEALQAIGQKPKELVHEHAELGLKGLWTSIIVGVLAIVTFFRIKKKYGSRLMIITFVTLMANTIFLAKVGNAGGVIRHTEVRPNSNPNQDTNEDTDEKSDDDH